MPEYAEPVQGVVYWNPDIFIGNNATDTIQFYTADKPGVYKVVIEGLEHTGKLGRVVSTFKVK